MGRKARKRNQKISEQIHRGQVAMYWKKVSENERLKELLIKVEDYLLPHTELGIGADRDAARALKKEIEEETIHYKLTKKHREWRARMEAEGAY
jgi:hypothetical protein